MKECQSHCPLQQDDATTYDMHPACIPCGHYRRTGRSEDLLKVSWDTLGFTVFAAGTLSLILAAQGLLP